MAINRDIVDRLLKERDSLIEESKRAVYQSKILCENSRRLMQYAQLLASENDGAPISLPADYQGLSAIARQKTKS